MKKIEHHFPDHYQIGTIHRTHGVKGDLIMSLDTDTTNRYKSLQLIYESGFPNQNSQAILDEQQLAPEDAAYRHDGSLVTPKKFLDNLKLEDIKANARTIPPDDPQSSYQYNKYWFC